MYSKEYYDVATKREELTSMLSLMSALVPFMDYIDPGSQKVSKPFEDAFVKARDKAIQLSTEFVALQSQASARDANR